MKKNEYYIKGVNFKTEIILGLSLIPFILIIGIILIQTYHEITGTEEKNIPYYIVFSSLVTGASVGLLLTKLLGKILRKEFLFSIDDNAILVKSKLKSLKFEFTDIKEISIVGTSDNMRYFKITTNQYKLKIRLGTYNLAPFSDKEDIATIDDLIEQLAILFKNKDFSIKKINVKNITNTVILNNMK